MNDPWIAPSILAADFARLGDEVASVLEAGADIIHFDVMDNHYVPNLTVGPMVLSALRKFGIKSMMDVHLMVKPVDRLIGDFVEAGADMITFHPEASDHVDRSLSLIKSSGAKCGLVLNPATPLSVLDYTLEGLDMVLVMSINPGFGGQTFLPMTYQKIEAIRQRIDAVNPSIRLEVDGGVKIDNIGAIKAAGADTFVAGTAIFGADDYGAVISAMRQAID
ncbi:MAG: ribulose-phosphate 3-epimerase [Gammaproteobacteria bacterium]|nr:ribulose-phosphate 3-epimerase [Gammaproteobacteria bacterium]|tara:strand:- start:5134 stop:5796 length:663 start_codon:yes stop_codon:yes gene_type:complete